MKNLKFYLIMILILIVSIDPAVGQKKTNVNALKAFSEKKAKEWKQKRAEAEIFAKAKNIPIKFTTKSGKFMELQYVEDGIPMYYTTENVDAAATISTDQVHAAPYLLQGQDMIVHEWDAGAVRSTHQEFGGRVTQGDGAQTTHYHATHVAGTIIASGVDPFAKGMAPLARLRAFDWNSDDAEMASEAAAGALYSNHSYGYRRGWSVVNGQWTWYGNTSISTQEDYKFGFYDNDSRAWDQIAYDAPYYLIVKSAGNDRGDGPLDNPPYPPDGPYDCIGTHGIAKNILTVGAVADIDGGYQNPDDVRLASFSSWGPADDGRIKPDIVANGLGLRSAMDDAYDSYASLSGTSMSTPNVTGSLVLLQEQYQKDKGSGNYMLAATLKALVIATADEAGIPNGPDYEYGWGLMNTQSAVDKIIEDRAVNVVDELELTSGSSYTRLVHSDGNADIKITICWTDVPGTPVAASLDPSNAMLVNDLDLKVTIGTETFYPWRLDRNNPTLPAQNDGKNYVDNVEMIFIPNPGVPGDYLITVDHEGSLTGGSQAFSIILDGVNDNVALTADFEIEDQLIYLGDTVNFTDMSSGAPDSWAWIFTGGDPASSTDQNPAITYNTLGLHDVTLTIERGTELDVITKENFIDVLAPFADFSSDKTVVGEGGSVSFTDKSMGNPDSWLWTFEGVTPATSTDQNPTVSYSSTGNYDVTLEFVQDGQTYTESVAEYITVETITYCTLVSSNYSSEYISNVTVGNIDNTSTGSNYTDYTAQTFNAEPGLTYNISLTPYKSSPSRKHSWRVWIDYNIDGDFTDAGELVFTTDRKRNPVTGTFTVPSGASGNSRMRIAMAYNTTSVSSCGTIAYGEAEDYGVAFSAPVPQAPIVEFSGSPTTVAEGSSVQFTDQSLNNPTSWSWTFAGGTPSSSTVQNPSITYDTEGTYDVTLTATNGQGSNSLTKTDYITVNVQGTVDYCDSYSGSYAVEYISSVEIGDFSNTSDGDFYSDFTDMVVDMTPGTSLPITLTPTFSGRSQREFWRIWIDFNQDSDFEDTGEAVFVANNKKTAVTGYINVPSGLSGTTRMRITMKGGSSPSYCELFSAGEVEDYNVDFGTPKISLGSGEKTLGISIYPNPAEASVNIMLEGLNEDVELSIFNSSGELMIEKTQKMGLHQINTSDFPSGVYYIRIRSGVNHFVEKFIKL